MTVKLRIGHLLFVTMTVLAFYVRSADIGGGFLQLAITGGFAGFLALTFALVLRRPRVLVDRQFRHLRWLTWALIASSIASSAVNLVPLGDFARVEIRILSFAAVLLLVIEMLERGGSVHDVIVAVVGSTLIAVLTSVFNSLVLQGLSLSTVRYRLIAGSGVVLLGFLIPYVTLRGRGLMAAGLAGVLGMLVLFTETRGYLLALGAAMIVYAVLLFRQGRLDRIGFLILASIVGTFLILANAGSGAIAALSSRINAGERYSGDPTTMTRFAEYSDQMRQFSSSALNVLFGMGPGHRFQWDYAIYHELIVTGVIPTSQITERNFDFGHSLFVYSIFAQGLLGGWIIIAMLVGAGINAAAAINRATDLPTIRRYEGVVLSMVIVLVFGLTSYPIADRHSGVMIAAICVLGYCPVALMVPSPRRRHAAARVAPRRGYAPSSGLS